MSTTLDGRIPRTRAPSDPYTLKHDPWASCNIQRRWKMKLAKTAVLASLAATAASAQTNLGAQKPEASLPFVMTQLATFNLPWRLAFLPDGRMLITEKVGPLSF